MTNADFVIHQAVLFQGSLIVSFLLLLVFARVLLGWALS